MEKRKSNKITWPHFPLCTNESSGCELRDTSSELVYVRIPEVNLRER